jgi:predicted enzyme related to lactoylglutathione lyase
MDNHLEVVVVPVSDVDRAKAFYSMLGWRLDADVSGGEYWLVQFTLPRPSDAVTTSLHGQQRAVKSPGQAL